MSKQEAPIESIDDLKNNIVECEKRYKESFKTNMCKEIMNSWYALQNAKSKYYKATKTAPDNEYVQNNDDLVENDDFS